MDLSLRASRRLLEETGLEASLRELPTLQGVALDAPPKPREILKFTTKTTVAEALKASVHRCMNAWHF